MRKKNTKQTKSSQVLERELYNLFEESAAPRKEFVENLETQVVSQAQVTSPQSNFISQLFMKLSKPTVKMAAFAAVVVIGAGAAGYTYMYPKEFARQNEILAKIAQANEGVKRDASNATAMSGEADQKISALYIRLPEDREYNYRKYTNTYEIGAAAAKCTAMVPYQGSVVKDELYEYFSTKEEGFPKYMKSVAYTGGKDIYDFNLTVDTDRWQYRGGSYAVHQKNVQQIMPLASSMEFGAVPENTKSSDSEVSLEELPQIVDSEVTATGIPEQTEAVRQNPSEIVRNYFGEDAKIIGVDTINGKKVYKAQWIFKTNCSDMSSSSDTRVSSSPAESDQQIVVVALADAENFEIVDESYYFGAVSNRNLLYAHGMSQEKRNVTNFSDIKNEFTLPSNVTIRTVDLESYHYHKEQKKAALAYLSDNIGEVAYLTSKATLQSVSSPYVTEIPDYEKHLVDRDFYSVKPYGQILYDQNKDMYKADREIGKIYPVAQLVYEGEGTRFMPWIVLSLMPITFKGSDAVEVAGADRASVKNIGSTTIKVDGQETIAAIYQNIPEEIGRSSGGSSDSSVSDSAKNIVDREQHLKDIYIVFGTKGITAVLQTNVGDKISLDEIGEALKVATIKTSDISKLDKVLAIP
ncbi:hypothetical protein IT418_02160 [bacterium]|nr:hypothetical protein [bacterium]